MIKRLKNLRKAFKKDTWVKTYVRKNRGMYALSVFLGVLYFSCAAALMFISGFLISLAATMPNHFQVLAIWAVLLRAFGVGRPAFKYAQRIVSHNWVLKITSFLRRRLYCDLETDAMNYKQRYQSGNILSLLSDDIGHVQNLYIRSILPLLTAWVLYFLVVLGFGLFSPLFALWMFIAIFMLAVLAPLFSLSINTVHKKTQKEHKNALYTGLTDAVLGIGDWICSGKQELFLQKIKQQEKTLKNSESTLNAFNRRRNLIQKIWYTAIVVTIICWAANYILPETPAFTLWKNWIAAFVLAIFPLTDAFLPLSEAITELTDYEDSLQRLNSLQIKVQNECECAVLPSDFTALHINGVQFTYRLNAPLLSDFSLQMNKGEKIVVLGKNGAGKSTLIKLIRGDIQPQAGSLLFDFGKTKIPAADFGRNISEYVSLLQQNPFIFNTTIRNNLALGKETASDEEILYALEQVDLRKKVESLPEGLQTVLYEGGKRFSGGERQRLALARILLKNTPLILLDEPTVSLDPVTEQKLLNTLFKTLQDKTVLWVTHHLQGIEAMDKVIFIQNGKPFLEGTPHDLAKNNPYYQNLLELDRGFV